LCVFCADFHFPLYVRKIEMFFALWIECSALSDINYETMNSGNTMTLSANPIVEKCLAKMANDVTTQVRDKLVDIIIAVLTRECEDFDGETVRRLIYAELESTPMHFALEKHVAAASKTPKTKVVELDADGNPVKKVRTPKEPKEKAPKAAKEPKAPKAPKVELTEEEREALKAAKQAEREAAKEARKAEKAAAKDADKEAAKAAAKAEKEAAKEAAKAEREAEKAAAKEAAKAEKEAAKLAKPAKEQRLPIPWCGKRIDGRCEALRAYHGLFAQCTADATEISAFCPSCEKSGAPFGTCTMRLACGIFDYTAPNGKKCVRLANVIDKFGFAEAGEQAFQEEAAKHNITIPYEHLEKEVKQRGRPKSSSPRARPATAAKIATSDTGSGSETETDDEEYQAKKQQQQRKKVTKTAAAAATDAAPKKRGRPAKAKEAAPEPKDDLIQGLVASAKKAATPKAKSAPTSPELSEDEVTPVAVVAATKPKLVAKPKAAAKPKAPERNVIEMDGENYWVEECSGEKVLVRCSDNYAFNLSGEGLGVWDNKTKTIIEDEDEESSCGEE
jgi:DNA segregation ATPase FtsK/SpoIIIE-like protein